MKNTHTEKVIHQEKYSIQSEIILDDECIYSYLLSNCCCMRLVVIFFHQKFYQG